MKGFSDFRVVNRSSGIDVCIIRQTIRELVLDGVEQMFCMCPGDATEEEFEIIEIPS